MLTYKNSCAEEAIEESFQEHFVFRFFLIFQTNKLESPEFIFRSSTPTLESFFLY
jgi:hypothetical protein